MNVLYAILALGLLIILHEAGHFLAARWCGMKVHEFAIGFGPRLFSFKHGDTTYTLRAIFLGGYVRIAGMHPGEEDAKAPNSFLGSAPWKRFLAILAGPLANYITAFVIFFLIFAAWGVPDFNPEVKQVSPSSLLAKAGLKPGDRILSVNGKRVIPQRALSPAEQVPYLIANHTKKSVLLTVTRGSKTHKILLLLRPPKTEGKPTPPLGLKFETREKLWIQSVKADSVAAKSGLLVGDQLVKLDKHPLHREYAFLRYLKQRRKQASKLHILRAGKALTLTLPKATPKASWKIGVTLRSKATAVIESVEEGFNLGKIAGLRKGDQIRKVGKRTIQNIPGKTATQQLHTLLAQCTNKAIKLNIRRDKKTIPLTIPQQKSAALCQQGLSLLPTVRVLAAAISPKSTARKIDLRPGDHIVSINETPIHTINGLIAALKTRIYQPIKLTLRRGSKTIIKHVPMAKDDKHWKLGFQPIPDYSRLRKGFSVSGSLAASQTWRWNVRIYEGLSRIFRGREKAQFTGPVGIVNQTQQAVLLGFDYFLKFVAVISIHLAFFNLLPIPALDGGRLMFLLTQQVIRLFGLKDDIGIRIETVANVVSFILLFGLLILITFNDIYRLIFG